MKNPIAIPLYIVAAITLIPAQDQVRDINVIGPVTEAMDMEGYSTIHFVSHSNGSNETGDGSRSEPWSTITYALATVGDKTAGNRAAILVAAGMYQESTIVMQPFIDLYGGFSSSDWERDVHEYSTVLNGGHIRRVVEGADHSRIDGFTIADGQVRGHGGGILCDDTSPTISNCFIVRNLVLEPEHFNHNRIHQEGHHGAGIAALFNSVPVIRNNVFYNNQTSIGNGAGVAFYGWQRIEGAPSTEIRANAMVGGLQPVVENNVYVNNISGVNDVHRTRSSNGAAISCAYEARPVIANNVIVYNQAKGRSDAGGIYSEYFSYPVISGNWILGNISDDDGGGIYAMRMGHATITKNFIAGNWTRGNGAGGIRLSKEGRALITGNILVRNQTGGALQCIDSFMEMKNNVIMHNKGKSSLLFVNHFSYQMPSVIENNIIRENENKLQVESANGSSVKFINNNIDEKISGKKNTDREVRLIADDAKLMVVQLKFDPSLYQTIIEVDPSPFPEPLLGRVIRMNDFWSVVCKWESNKISVWGDAREQFTENSELEIISNYRISN